METKQKLFAFKLAAKEDTRQAGIESQGKWKAQEGVAVAGCTDYRFPGNLRYDSVTGNRDTGIYC